MYLYGIYSTFRGDEGWERCSGVLVEVLPVYLGSRGVQEDMDIWGMEGARGVHEDICHRGTSGISGVWKVQGGYKRISGTRGRTRGYPRLKNALIYIEQVQKHPVTKSYIFSNQVSSMPLATAPVISSSVEGVLVRWNYCVRV